MFGLLEGKQQKPSDFSVESIPGWPSDRNWIETMMVIESSMTIPSFPKLMTYKKWLTYSVVIIQYKGMDRRKKDAKAAKNPRVGPENLEPRNLFLGLSLRLSSFCLPKPCYFDLWKELKQRLSFWSQDDCLSDEINMRHQSHEFRHPGCAMRSPLHHQEESDEFMS